MRVGDSNSSHQTRRNEDKKIDKPSVQDKPKTETKQDKPQVSFKADRFEPRPTRSSNTVNLTGDAPAQAAANTAKALTASAASAVNSASSSSAPSTAATTAADAQRILDTAKNNPAEATHALAEELRDPNTTQAQREALVTAIIEQDPNTAAQILNEAGKSFDIQGKVTDADRQLITQTVGQAWEHSNPAGRSPATPGTSGTLDSADLRAVLSPNNMNANPDFGAQAHNLGNVFANSGSSSLQQSASTQMYNIGKDIAAGNPVDGGTADSSSKDIFADSYLAGAALAASGSPQAAQNLMNHVSRSGGATAVNDFVERTSPVKLSTTYGPDAENALGKLMQAVGNQPATPAADQFFDAAVHEASAAASGGLRYTSAEESVQELQKGLSQYFQTNIQHTTDRWASSSALADRASYAAFTSNVVFGDSFEGQDGLRKALADNIGQRTAALQDVPYGSEQSDIQAQRLGFLIGGAEVGFQRALGRVKESNAAREAMADFVIDMAVAAGGAAAGGKLPNIEFGPINLQDTLTDALKDKVHEWVRSEEPDANELTRPLREMGLSIEESYRSEMDAARSGFHDDELMTYLNEEANEPR